MCSIALSKMKVCQQIMFLTRVLRVKYTMELTRTEEKLRPKRREKAMIIEEREAKKVKLSSRELTVIQVTYEDPITMQQSEVKVPYFNQDGKIADLKYESKPRFTTVKPHHYKYSLVVRPNGHRYSESYETTVAIWLRALPSDSDDDLPWPATVKMQLSLLRFNKAASCASKEKAVTIPMQEYSWERHWTQSQYPAFYFNLEAFQHSSVEQECVDNEGWITFAIDESAA